MTPNIAVAQYLVNECSRYGPVTPLKLQKLLYYVKAWGTVAGKKLVPGSFEKWDYGPANPEVYSTFKQHGRDPIPKHACPSPRGKKKQLVDFISICYAQYDAVTLSRMTHKEEPWRETPSNAVISEDLMRDYYSNHPFARNFPFNPNEGPFYPVGSGTEYGFTLDMNESEAERITTYDSFSEYLSHIQRATDEYNEWRDSFLA